MARVFDKPPQSNAQERQHIDHVARLVGLYYSQRDDELLLGKHAVTDLLEQFGSPLYVYDQTVISRKVEEVKAILPDRFELFYSIKANPNAAILRTLLQQGCGLEIASGGELARALAAGCAPGHIIFAGPGKTDDELGGAVSAGIREIHVESLEEARALDTIAKSQGRTVSVALRVNPLDSAGGAMRMGGKPSPFGIDEEQLDEAIDEILELNNLRISGVHLFMGTQILDADVLIGQYQRALTIAKRVADRVGPLGSIDFGGGWGTPCFSHETPLDLNKVASGLLDVDREMAADPLLANTKAIIEPGRFLVNEAGVYLSKVLRTKQSREKLFAVLDGGMHHHLAASGNLGQTIKRNYPIAIANKLGIPAEQCVELVGPLCTPLDTLGRSVELPALSAGDVVAVFLSGAYARTSSPLGFLSHNGPAEVLVADENASLIRRRGTPEDHFADELSVPEDSPRA